MYQYHLKLTLECANRFLNGREQVTVNSHSASYELYRINMSARSLSPVVNAHGNASTHLLDTTFPCEVFTKMLSTKKLEHGLDNVELQ